MARGVSLALTMLVGCSYTPVPTAADDETPPVDAATDARQVIDAPPIDMMIDSPPGSSVTDHPPVADVFITAFNVNTNFNTDTSMLADLDGRVALQRFDLTSISTTATVTAVELHIWTDFDPGGRCDFFPLLVSWDETTATWNRRSANDAWPVAGAEPPARSVVSAGFVQTPAPANTEFVVTIDPAIVGGWVANPATNFGFAIVSSDVDGARFTTREGSANRQAILRVTHSP